MDEWADLLFQASYDGFVFDCVSTDDDVSRVLAEHVYPFRDGAVLQDMGAEPRRMSCSIVFIPTEDQSANHIDRFATFKLVLDAAHTRDQPPVLVHPLTGAFRALPGPIRFSATAEQRDFISVEVEFVEAGLDPAAFTTTDDQSVGSGVVATETARDDVDNAVTDVDADADPDLADELEAEPLTVQDDALTLAESWENNADITPRQVNLELNQITNTIIEESLRLQVATNVRRYPMFLALQNLHAAIRFAAELAIATGPKLFEYVVPRTEPLLSICQTVYGGTQALERYTRARELNDVINPSRVPAGTKLTLEQP